MVKAVGVTLRCAEWDGRLDMALVSLFLGAFLGLWQESVSHHTGVLGFCRRQSWVLGGMLRGLCMHPTVSGHLALLQVCARAGVNVLLLLWSCSSGCR